MQFPGVLRNKKWDFQGLIKNPWKFQDQDKFVSCFLSSSFRDVTCFCNIILWNFVDFVLSRIFKGKVTNLLKFPGFLLPKRMPSTPSPSLDFFLE